MAPAADCLAAPGTAIPSGRQRGTDETEPRTASGRPALGDLFAAGAAPVRLSTELSFVQAFRFDDGASYELIVDPDTIVQFFGTEVLGFVRGGTAAEAATAWKAALDGARSPLASSTASAAAAADALSAAVFDELYLHTTGAITAAPSDPGVVAAIAADARALLVNTDGARSFATRRLVVDALEKAQNQSAFLALRDARDAITATLNGLGPSDRALTEDLLARITAAISPYFE